MVRESQRLGKSLKNFESALRCQIRSRLAGTKLVDLEKQCSTGLADLADKLQKQGAQRSNSELCPRKVTSTCVQSLPKLTGSLDASLKGLWNLMEWAHFTCLLLR